MGVVVEDDYISEFGGVDVDFANLLSADYGGGVTFRTTTRFELLYH